MDYFVKRGEQRLGPYSLAQLQQRVATLSILPTDLAQSEGMADWAPISQIIGTIPVPVPSPVGNVYGAAAAPAMAVETVPLPPNIPWVVVLLMSALSRLWGGFILFNLVWTMILANWARKLDGDNNTLVLVAMYPAGIVSAVGSVIVLGGNQTGLVIAGLLFIGGVIAYIIGVFKIKAAMEEYYNSTENIGLKLSGPMTFFFSIIYFQYHINKIAKWKTTGVLA